LRSRGTGVGGTDPEMLCGFGRRDGRTIAYVAQTGGVGGPAGFRTAARLLGLAARLRLPVLTLIDTPGPANGADAARGAVGTAIGELFQRVVASTVPITSLVIGEGGSGGALALASPDRLWIAPDAYFAVIAPEGAAAILERDPSRAPAIAERMHLRPADLLRLGHRAGRCRR
jgi:acyl-CoA carboxylase subunit beta